MIRTVVKVAVALAALGGIAGAVVGTGTVKGLFGSARSRLRAEAREYIDPEVEARQTIDELRKALPAKAAAAGGALRRCEEQLAAQTRTVAALAEGLRLIERDLARLAEAVHAGRGLTLRGRRLSPDEARAEAARLMAKKQHREVALRTRRALVESLRGQRDKLRASVREADELMAAFSRKAREAATKAAMLKQARQIEEISRAAGAAPGLGEVSESLAALNRDLDRRLEEADQRQRLDAMIATDTYDAEVETAAALEQLKEQYPPKAKDTPAGGKEQEQ